MDGDEIYLDDMTVTDCPDCLGTGNVGEELACGNPDAFFDDFGRHVVPVDELEGETGPETLGLHLVGEVTVGLEKKERPDEIIGVVKLGDDSGLAQRVSRALGGSDEGFTQPFADVINEYREAFSLFDYPESTVMGKLWACVLPPLTVGSRGVEVMWLCRALGLEPSKVLTRELMAEAVMASNPEFFEGPQEDVERQLDEYEFDMLDWLEVL